MCNKIIDCLLNCIFGLSTIQGYIVVIMCVVTFLFGPIMLGIHHESSIDLPIWVLIISYICTGFWGLIVGLIVLLIIFLTSYILVDFCISKYCDCCCIEEEESHIGSMQIEHNINIDIIKQQHLVQIERDLKRARI